MNVFTLVSVCTCASSCTFVMYGTLALGKIPNSLRLFNQNDKDTGLYLGLQRRVFFFPLKSWHTGTMCSDTSKKTKMRNVTPLSLHKWMFSHWWASVHVRLPVHSWCMVHWLWGRYLTGYDCLIRTTRIRVCIWDYNDASCFYPGPVLAFGYCRCLRLSVCPSVRVCGNHLLVRAIPHHPFKLGSANLDHRCKRPW